ncbi:unnamed protein product [Cyprideis torosa]|uniref:Uncharacterized protein n=1 Tax=Cyprideis torosa TaxID=163714 RepID=A0A7R8WB40_9CRUS|nr:unnamed protein product [Cyprideis torosa]CAG0890387.1 unnamed protein product [Cyprideis torosa]
MTMGMGLEPIDIYVAMAAVNAAMRLKQEEPWRRRERERAIREQGETVGTKLFTDGSRMGNLAGMGFFISIPGEEDIEASIPVGQRQQCFITSIPTFGFLTEVSLMFCQEISHLEITMVRCHVERSPLPVSFGIDVSSASQQNDSHLEMTTPRCQVEGRTSPLLPGIDFGIILQQEDD